MDHTATYSPDDNKLRLYPAYRLPADEYARVKVAGFSWAPKQDLFVAPMWTPAREDLAIELAGEIGDEDTSLIDRAEERADRFGDYSDSRARDAEAAHKAVSAIADNIPLGQPILVGHHSERHARKDAERIENGMRKSIKMWETAEYWKSRAAAAISHAKYKELPAVRARRIKGIEADKRKEERAKAAAEKRLKFWSPEWLDNPDSLKRKDGQPTTIHQRARFIANQFDHFSKCFTLADYPRNPPVSQYEGDMCLWSALGDTPEQAIITPQQAAELAMDSAHRVIASCNRWIAHYDFRLTYERAMLVEQGGTAADKFPLEVGGRVLIGREWVTIKKINRAGDRINSVTTTAQYGRVTGVEHIRDYQPPEAGTVEAVKAAMKLPPLCNYPGEGITEITRETWDKKWKDYKGSRIVEATEKAGAHRARFMLMPGHVYGKVFISDDKRKDPPSPPTTPTPAPEIPPNSLDLPTLERRNEAAQKRRKVEPSPAEAMRDSLKAGVQVVTAPQLFPTPPELARRMVELADIQPGHRVLEPSAGTGALLRAITLHEMENLLGGPALEVIAVEINERLTGGHLALAHNFIFADFLTCNGDLGEFDRVVMNPPFSNAQDIAHIQHARTFLAPGGRLVAICANGPRQREKLMPEADEWIDLPTGSFSESGTNVNVAMCVFIA